MNIGKNRAIESYTQLEWLNQAYIRDYLHDYVKRLRIMECLPDKRATCAPNMWYNTFIMGSINAQRAAIKVSENVRKGKKVVLGKILTEVGYSPTVANAPQRVTETQSYKTALALESRPLINGIQKEISRIKEALESKDWRKEDVRVLIGALDILIKNYQLLSGGATERQVFVLPSEVIARNAIATSKDDSVNDTKPIDTLIGDGKAQQSHDDVPEGPIVREGANI